jgi:hypothetical protein
MISVGWLDSRAIHFLSTADTTAMTSAKTDKNEKVELTAPEIVSNYNKFMGGVDKHDKLRSIFSLGKYHKFKKYFVKLWLFLVDIALTNCWIYNSICHPEKTSKLESREDFFLSIAQDLVHPGYDWAAKYKIKTGSLKIWSQMKTQPLVSTFHHP